MSDPGTTATSSMPSPSRYHDNPMTSRSREVRVGSRDSALAMIQTNSVVDKLKALYHEVRLPVKKVKTTGDVILGVPLAKIGEKSLFTKELEVALENRDVDFVVHSLKDLPTTLPPNMVIGAVLRRESPFDACVLSKRSLERGFGRLADLPPESVVGTSSLRRIAQLRRLHPRLHFHDVRGNLNTRMRKLDDEGFQPNFAALILAESGMVRMGPSWADRVTRSIPPEECMYAVGQGALAVECREDDLETLAFLSLLHDELTTYRVVAERALLKVLEGGCSAPVAVATDISGDNVLTLNGGVFSLDGSEAILERAAADLGPILRGEEENPTASSKRPRSTRTYSAVWPGGLNEKAMEAAESLGVRVAERLVAAGAGPVLAAAKAEVERGREESERRKTEALEKERMRKEAEERTREEREGESALATRN